MDTDGQDPLRLHNPVAVAAGGTVFDLIWPDPLAAPILFNSPHSGDAYPEDFLALTRLGLRDLRRSADLFMDDLAGGAISAGLPLMHVHLPRSVVDMNRDADDLDPEMFDAPLAVPVNRRSLRVSNGYGVIPRLVADSVAIYGTRIAPAVASDRLARCHAPYHTALDRALAALAAPLGWSLIVDCHSMPSAAPTTGSALADIVLGDRNATSCDPAIIDCAETLFTGLGFSVARNQPYAGGFITSRHGRPWDGRHALQIEVNRALYMDEATYRPHRGYHDVRRALARLAGSLVALAPSIERPVRRAAE